MLPICVTFCWTDSQLDNPWFNAHEITYILYCFDVQEKGYCKLLCRCFCELSCGLIMSLTVLMFFVDKTSLELVYLKQKRISKKKSCLLKKISCEEKKKTNLFQNKFCVGLWSIDVIFSFIVDYLEVFVFSKMWFFFSFKEKKWKYIVPNSKGTSFLELQCVSCEK